MPYLKQIHDNKHTTITSSMRTSATEQVSSALRRTAKVHTSDRIYARDAFLKLEKQQQQQEEWQPLMHCVMPYWSCYGLRCLAQ